MPRIGSPTVFIGVDPGKQGGLVALTSSDIVYAPMLGTERDVWDWFQNFRGNEIKAVVERVHAMPKNGAVSMFTFGQGYGMLRMALTAIECSWEDVTPQSWMKAMGISLGKGNATDDKKEKLRAHAQRLFPKLEVWRGTLKVQ